jgi:inorganic triphosphatase YgiF
VTADPSSPADEPTRSVEIELKFDVDDTAGEPDWSTLPGVAGVTDPEHRELDAVYLDTDTATLARAGYALRRRTGGPDAGWHIKGPRRPDGGRVELHWPLGDDDQDDHGHHAVPAAVAAEIAHLADASTFVPLARIRNTRTVRLMMDAASRVVAEFADDHVQTTDERTGTQRSWHEWEIELGPAGPVSPEDREAFFAAVEHAAFAAGARAATSTSKLARALGA